MGEGAYFYVKKGGIRRGMGEKRREGKGGRGTAPTK